MWHRATSRRALGLSHAWGLQLGVQDSQLLQDDLNLAVQLPHVQQEGNVIAVMLDDVVVHVDQDSGREEMQLEWGRVPVSWPWCHWEDGNTAASGAAPVHLDTESSSPGDTVVWIPQESMMCHSGMPAWARGCHTHPIPLHPDEAEGLGLISPHSLGKDLAELRDKRTFMAVLPAGSKPERDSCSNHKELPPW